MPSRLFLVMKMKRNAPTCPRTPRLVPRQHRDRRRDRGAKAHDMQRQVDKKMDQFKQITALLLARAAEAPRRRQHYGPRGAVARGPARHVGAAAAALEAHEARRERPGDACRQHHVASDGQLGEPSMASHN